MTVNTGVLSTVHSPFDPTSNAEIGKFFLKIWQAFCVWRQRNISFQIIYHIIFSSYLNYLYTVYIMTSRVLRIFNSIKKQSKFVCFSVDVILSVTFPVRALCFIVHIFTCSNSFLNDTGRRTFLREHTKNLTVQLNFF